MRLWRNTECATAHTCLYQIDSMLYFGAPPAIQAMEWHVPSDPCTATHTLTSQIQSPRKTQ